MEWQPIETAPKDAHGLLLYCGRRGAVSGGWWDDQKFHKNPKPYWAHHATVLWGVLETRDNQPTHWMIPTPPKEQNGN